MKPTQSIKFRLVTSLWLLFAAIACVGMFGLGRLETFNHESSDIRERWLKSTRYVGDLTNFTSDFRAAEGAFLLAPKDVESTAMKRETAALDAAIAKARKGYEDVRHDEAEAADYRLFVENWQSYRSEARRTFEVMERGDKAEAARLFMTDSRAAYDATSDALEKISDRNNLRARMASERAERAIGEARALIVAVLILGVSMALAIMRYVTLQIADPLVELAASMRRLAKNDTGIEIESTERSDELGEMARAVAVFRDNAIQLQVNHRALATEASLLEEKLAHEQRLSEHQRNFVSMVSHEFRTPMTIIDGHAQRLLNAPEGRRDKVVMERAKKIRVAVKRMSVMIEGLLQSSRVIESPRLYVHSSAFDMRELLKELCALHREISPAALIVEDYDADALPFSGDRNLIGQALGNLIANAIKYSSPGSVVRISARVRGKFLRVHVVDSGIGIPRRDIGNVFSRYYRASNVAGVTGAGIGLHLATIVVGLHGGAIKVRSREGVGSIFIVTLPHGAEASRAI